MTVLSGAHGGIQTVAAARQHGVDTVFTLSGAHVFPVYDGAVTAEPPLRLLDVRHEQTAVFAAEGMAKLTRTPGLAVVTAGPGVTNTVSAVTTAWFNGSPVVVLGGRAPAYRWGQGALQELDHPPLLASVTKHAATVRSPGDVAGAVDDAFCTAGRSHRGPVFLDVPMDHLFTPADAELTAPVPREAVQPDPADLTEVAHLLAAAERPVLVVGSDVWSDRADEAVRRLAETARLPVIANGMGRGVLPRGHELLVTRARSLAFGQADLVVVVGAPLDFRLGYGVFGGRDGTSPAPVVHLADAADQVATHTPLAASASGDLTAVADGLRAAWEAELRHPDLSGWLARLQGAARAATADDAEVLGSAAHPIHPARIYGELRPRLADDAVVIGDGGDFVSFAGRFVEPSGPGSWLDPGPFGCLGTGPGYAIAARLARPHAQVVLLLGDGAVGFSLADIDTLVRHRLPVVMVVGNNGVWGLEKHPMQLLYGYDVVADLTPQTRYDEVA
ncbi:MAG: acetolactate synthase, partial [Actinomycetota bacterium]|nr:acetolactate synthase [Actinomycetota bacterium]